jgi:hypothetical protein
MGLPQQSRDFPVRFCPDQFLNCRFLRRCEHGLFMPEHGRFINAIPA